MLYSVPYTQLDGTEGFYWLSTTRQPPPNATPVLIPKQEEDDDRTDLSKAA